MIPERFWHYVDKTEGCWEWTGGHNSHDYAIFRSHAAHRILWEHLNGPVPRGLELDHLCRNRGCVNPAHLEAVTHSENVLRGIGPEIARRRHAAVTHCPHGHAYDATNTHRNATTGQRTCRTCNHLRYIRSKVGAVR